MSHALVQCQASTSVNDTFRILKKRNIRKFNEKTLSHDTAAVSLVCFLICQQFPCLNYLCFFMFININCFPFYFRFFCSA